MEIVIGYLLGASSVALMYSAGRLLRGWRIVTHEQRVQRNLRRI